MLRGNWNFYTIYIICIGDVQLSDLLISLSHKLLLVQQGPSIDLSPPATSLNRDGIPRLDSSPQEIQEPWQEIVSRFTLVAISKPKPLN
jgi:hypothetical protein